MSDPLATEHPTSHSDTAIQNILGLLETGLIICNSQGKVFLWNGWMEKTTDISSQEAQGKTLQKLFADRQARALLEAIQDACNHRLSRRLSHQLHPHLLPLHQKHSGQYLHHSVIIRPLDYAGQNACLLQINDVSSTVRRELHLREAEALLRFEKDILSLVAHNQPINNVWQALISGMEKLAPATEAGLLLVDQQQLINPLPAGSRLLPSKLPLQGSSTASQAAASLALAQGQLPTPGSSASWWAYPVTSADGQLTAIIQLAWSKQAEPSIATQLLERSAQLASIALQNHQQLIQVRYLAEHDSLTGLANRSLLTRQLQAACDTAASNPQSFALLFIDLDGFKAINDNYGHDAGDALLVELAQRLEKQLAAEDWAARLGGDELIIFSQTSQNLEQAFQLAKRINQLLAEPFDWQATRLSITASIGVALYPDQGRSANQLLTQADNAMYLAKSRGKGQAASCDP